ncbi:uncharacterized protein LOC111707669 isoform X2 [Eurytemora carolleeae]|uniref:uncharacterized protein LOC111707669 isoform X2 n=1 Tax=Eurytemora carolleeae TaxID=1294199 RepID=UPI000C775FDC|nr:uncharacterized protein LOC111707669 isoform X2 [Eurytemora carolleeae]|eukprot:XP_023336579.1 uncharacterized protein LOC111707669 isoform X2 [Eurytemora affinis]
MRVYKTGFSIGVSISIYIYLYIISDENPINLISEKEPEFSAPQQLRIWIDVPNDFPWRKCLLDYNGVAATSECILKSHPAATWYIPLRSSKFKIINKENDRCLQPDQTVDMSEKIVVITGPCHNKTDDQWEHTPTGQLKWSTGGCLTSQGNGNSVLLTPCNSSLAEQRFEFGLVDYNDQLDEYKLWPLDLENYKSRQKKLRDDELKEAKEEVMKTLTVEFKREIKEKRRAAVFYLDKGTGPLAFVNWWLLAWKLLGLNSKKERFDIVLFTHPDSIPHLPKECKEYRDNVKDLKGVGKCLFVPLYGISYRDNNRYDSYVNSQYCLVSPHSRFLSQYSHILRADIDTFPTPGIVGSWPDRVLVNKYQAYTFRNSSGISKTTEALKDVTSSLGLKHNGWHDFGSSWFGPSEKILRLSLITVAISRYLRVYLFGPGTHCRCPSCTALPQDCQWGSGTYAGTILTYSQEIAINLVWTQEDYDSLKADARASCFPY